MAKCGNCGSTGVDRDHVRKCYGVDQLPLGAEIGTVESPHRESNVGADGRPIHEDDRVYLNVLFAEKDQARTAFGAFWNPDKKKWYVKKSADFDEMPPAWLAKTADQKERAEEGFYRQGDEVYKVVVAVHGSGLRYAKRLVHDVDPNDRPLGRWRMAEGMVFKLKPVDKLGFEEACKLGKLYGFCIRCGLTLTKEESIERGMGDICAGKAWQ